MRVLVCAVDVSVPMPTFVESVKFASEEFASPDPESLAVQEILTSVACQAVSGLAQTIFGAIVSRTVIVTTDDPVPPWPSFAVNVTVWTPIDSVTVICAPLPSAAAPSVQANVRVSLASGSLPAPLKVTAAPAGEMASTV